MTLRARRQTIARGLTGVQRKRMARILRQIAATGEISAYTNERHGVAFRDARRLSEAGLACVVASKHRPWMRCPIAEVTLFANRATALKRYPSWAIMPRRNGR
jgi:hypothetical protein